ncbi:MAG: SusC/RagA family TonB-linked outer membrane protein [Gemmatimonadales bacterium]|nr:MAG: SusC/RagA family TonB-linked outer membrane protein [Gemmatimonadales bacterium]
MDGKESLVYPDRESRLMTSSSVCRSASPERRTRRFAPVPAPLLAALLLVLPLPLLGQGVLTGTVTEAGTLRPLTSAQVFVVGTTVGALTNSRGQFTIPNVPAGEVQLRAELLGFAGVSRTVTVATGESVTVDFQLRQTTLALEQIVVTGAGAGTERRRLGNTIASIDVGELQSAPVSSMSEILTGREPGVLSLPGGGMAGQGARIRIRGSASLSQSNEPVIYVDGIRVDNAQGFGLGVGAPGGSPSRLDDINPESIERIEILKGAAAATLYGTQASNGVIQIFTKRGQSGAPRYEVSVEQGFTRYPLGRMPNHAGFVTGQGSSSRDVGVAGIQERWGLNVQPYEVFEVDMFSPLFGTGTAQTYSASVTGGNQGVTYYVSGRFHTEDGPYDGSAFAAPGFTVSNDKSDRMQFNANLEIFPRDDLRLRVSSSFTEMNHEVPDTNNNTFGVLSNVINSRPEKATASNLFGSPAFATNRETWLRTTSQDVQRFGSAFTAIWQARPSFGIDATIGIDFVNQRSVRFIPFGWNVDAFASSDVAGTRTVGDRNHREVTLDVKGNWNTAFGSDWTADVLVGAQGFLTQTKAQRGTGNAFPGPGLEVAGAGALQTLAEAFLEEANVGILGQAQVGFRDYAFLTVGARYDEHSAFGETAGGALYPKVSLSVVPSQLETWNPDLFSTLRVRGALGTSGLQPGAFDQFTTFSPLASSEGPGVAPLNLGNPDLLPETAREWEVGAEIGFFEDRASIEATYWNRVVSDALVDRQFAPSGGFRLRQLDNIGELQASGVEISLRAVAVTRPNFSTTLFANGSFLREEVTDLGDAPPLKVGGSYPRYRQFTREGYHPGAFFGPILDTSVEIPVHLGDCVPLSRSELSAFLSQPRNPSTLQPYVENCGTPEMLLNYLGKPIPDWQGAFGATTVLRGDFSLNTLFEYRFGNFFIHDLDGAFRRNHPLIGRNVRAAAEVEARLLDPASTVEQRVAAAETWVRDLQALSPYDGLNEIHEADWLRLREVSLTYRAPAAWAERVGAANLSITAAGRNLALWTKFPGTDPELETAPGDGGGGVDSNFNVGTVGWGVPIPRRFSFTVRAGF